MITLVQNIFLSIPSLAYLLLPAYIANMAPVLSRPWFKHFATPIDNNRWWHGQPLFGNHKTWRGILTGIAGAVCITLIQSIVTPITQYANYQQLWLPLGLAMGLGALGGDLLKSFFKRRRGFPPGARWIPWDQIDFIIGALILITPLVRITIINQITIIVGSFLGHVLVNRIGFWLEIKDTPW